MINDLKINDSNIWKFVDDTTLDEIVGKNEESKVQTLIDDLTRQISESQFKLNETKCKELRIGFCKPRAMFDPIIVNGEMLEVVDSAKILGLTVSNNLKWNNHIDQIISKARKRLYFLSQLKRARVGTKELVLFFTTCIRPILEYASPVFHNGLTNYLGFGADPKESIANYLTLGLIWRRFTINWPPTTQPSKRRSFRQTIWRNSDWW